MLEVGIDRTVRFTYKGGDRIEGLRIIPGLKPIPFQRIGIPLQRLDNLVKAKTSFSVMMEQLFAGNPCEARIHLGGLLMVFFSSRYQHVHVRQYCVTLTEGELQPTDQGYIINQFSHLFTFVTL